jgi:modulator of FtsH protease
MRPQEITSKKSYESVLATNRVLRNTYLLLSLTLLFSAGTSWFAIATNAKPVGIILMLVGFFGLQFLTISLRNSGWGVLAIFAFTGFLGYTLGPLLNFYIHAFSNGPQLVMTALGTTGLIFFGLSAYVLVSRKDFSYMGGFIAVAIMVAFILGIGAAVFNWPLMSLIVSGAFALLSSAYILYTTSQIMNGGETNYIMATISLYVAIFNLFVSLLRILSAFSGNRN